MSIKLNLISMQPRLVPLALLIFFLKFALALAALPVWNRKTAHRRRAVFISSSSVDELTSTCSPVGDRGQVAGRREEDENGLRVVVFLSYDPGVNLVCWPAGFGADPVGGTRIGRRDSDEAAKRRKENKAAPWAGSDPPTTRLTVRCGTHQATACIAGGSGHFTIEGVFLLM